MPNKVICDTKRLLIREYTGVDGNELGGFAGKESITRWLPDWIGAEEWATPWIDGKVMNGYKLNNPMEGILFYAVIEKESGKIIGNVGIHDFKESEVGVAYFVNEDYKCRGYITEAMQAFVEYIFSKFGYEYLITTIQPDNLGSIAVAKKIGFEYIETINIVDDGQIEELPFNYYHLKNLNKQN
ncbi:GNAT family N-acetyltransferase [Clostridium tagluense]|uniref:GNAT family N-acetyltransferase n=1 Tax=Clostridium tagluense TaxID=360422 RepID=UPI001CF4B0B0|nr:GNAT family N-acetyltransferase [Clostridium tagluense]MCB2298154.1 GNAT family N-acetyltransferase [Clostridium tagluense]